MNRGLVWCFDFPLSSLARFPLQMCLEGRLLLFFSLININKPILATLPATPLAWRKDWEDSGGAGSVLLPARGWDLLWEGSLRALPQVQQLLLRPAPPAPAASAGPRVNEWDRFLFCWLLLHGEWAALHWLGKDAACRQPTSASYTDAPENSWCMEDGFILLSIKGEVFPAGA